MNGCVLFVFIARVSVIDEEQVCTQRTGRLNIQVGSQLLWPGLPATLTFVASQRLSAGERVGKRAAIDVLELATERYTVSYTARTHATPRRDLTQIVGGRFAFDGRVGGEDELPYLAFTENRFELPHAELLGSDAIERREMAHEDEIAPAVAAGRLDRDDIGGRLDGTQERRIPLRCGADHAQLTFCQHATAPAAGNRLEGGSERLGEGVCSRAPLLQQVERHALRSLRAHSGQAAQRFDERREAR